MIRIIATIDTGAYRPFVAAGTAWVIAVIARVVALRVMAEVGRRPAIGGMAHIALCGSVYMTWWRRLGSCAVARAVAGVTVIDATGIVSPGAADKGCGGMAGGAVQAGWNMVRRHRGRGHAVTGRAIVGDTVWSKVAGLKALGVWQTPQSWLVATWPDFLGVANPAS